MIDIKKVYEDAIAAGGDAGSVSTGADTSVSGNGSETISPEISTDDVLGKCDHEHNGYMKDGCFHLPGKILKTLKRMQLKPKNAKKKKKKSL